MSPVIGLPCPTAFGQAGGIPACLLTNTVRQASSFGHPSSVIGLLKGLFVLHIITVRDYLRWSHRGDPATPDYSHFASLNGFLFLIRPRSCKHGSVGLKIYLFCHDFSFYPKSPERGLPAVIPKGVSLQLRITPISLRSMGFCFSSVLAHASMARSSEKQKSRPAWGRDGSNPELRREGIMNHLYKYLTIQLLRIYNLRYRLRISGNFHMPFICY